MFKALFRVAIAFAVVWMLVPHGAAVEFSRPGFAAVAHHFGWLHTPADFQRPGTLNQSPSAKGPSAARDCASVAAPKRHGAKRSAAAPECPGQGARQPVAASK
jgi:hypothetical protein